MRKVLLVITHFTDGKLWLERFSNLSKVTQQVSSRPELSYTMLGMVGVSRAVMGGLSSPETSLKRSFLLLLLHPWVLSIYSKEIQL